MVGYPGYMPFTDRIDYLAAMLANEGYAMAVERLLSSRFLRARSTCAPSRASCAAFPITGWRSAPWPSDIGASTPLTHALRERESINDLLEELCGARLTFNYARIGGVSFDAPEGWRERSCATSITWKATCRNGIA